jgi:hypothetical protein
MTQFPANEPYGFEYVHNGKGYAFHIVAESREEAEARPQSMAAATCLGRLYAASPPAPSEPERTLTAAGTST